MQNRDERLGLLGFFGWLPRDLFQLFIRRYLGPGAFSLAQTNSLFLTLLTRDDVLRVRYFHDLILLNEQVRNDPQILQLLKELYVRNPIRQLLGHAALGEWESVDAVLSRNNTKSLLTYRATIFHPNCIYEQGKPPVAISPYHNPGRYKYKKRTAIQIAWMNEEYDEADRMCQHILEDEVRRQFLEVFPDGDIKKYDWDIDHAKALLAAVYAAVINDKSIDGKNLDVMNDATKEALHAFYDYIKPAPVHEIGLVFDANIYVEALRLYDEQDDQNRGKFQNVNQESFWNIRVEEHIAALLGTGYLRPHAQGIGSKNTHRRGCTLSDNSSFFAFRQPVGSRLVGGDFYVGYYGARVRPARARPTAGWRPASRMAHDFFRTYVEQKQARRTAYAAIFRAASAKKSRLLG